MTVTSTTPLDLQQLAKERLGFGGARLGSRQDESSTTPSVPGLAVVAAAS